MTLLKEIKDQNKWKIFHIHGLEDIIVVKQAIFSKSIYRFSTISIKIPIGFFGRADPKIYMEIQGTLKS